MDPRNVLLSIGIFASVGIWNQCLGLNCLSCHGVKNISECLLQTASCIEREEECYLDAVRNPDSLVVYNAGCRAKLVCDLIHSGKRDKSTLERYRKQSTECAQCCKDNKNRTIPCNGYLCGQNPQPTNATICGVCEDTTDPTQCLITQQCPDNEICMQTSFVSGNTVHYYLGCERIAMCDSLLKNLKDTHLVPVGKRFLGHIQLCSACCDGYLCNKEKCSDLRRKQPCFDHAICG